MEDQQLFINHTIKIINDLTDTIYEEMYEENSEMLIKAVNELIELLKNIKEDYEEI